MLKRFFVLVLLFAICFQTGCAKIKEMEEKREAEKKTSQMLQQFQEAFPKPDWWEDSSVSGYAVKINTYKGLVDYIQGYHSKDRKKRSWKLYFKTLYEAILENPDNDDIVVNAISSLVSVFQTDPHVVPLLEFVVNKYFYYKMPTTYMYSGEGGDVIGSLVRRLAQHYNKKKQFEKSIGIIERLLKERKAELNGNVLEMLSLSHAEAFYGRKMYSEAMEILSQAIVEYEGSWEKKLREKLFEYKDEMLDTGSLSIEQKEVAKPQDIELPFGIRYLKVPEELNAQAKDLIGKAFLSNEVHSSESSIFQPYFICGPYLWHKIKDDPMVGDLSKAYKPFAVPIYKDEKLFGYRLMLAAFARDRSDAKIFRKLFAKYIQLQDEAVIRKLNTEELKDYWAMIGWDITEPIFMMDDGKTKVIVNLKVSQDGKHSLFWIDDFSGDLKEDEIGEFCRSYDFQSAMVNFMKKHGLGKQEK